MALGAERVLIATSEPLALDWLADVQHLSRRRIELALINPLDLHRYTMEFFGVTQSVRGARSDARSTESNVGLPSFEQLVELGRAGDVNADDHHIVHIVDWLLQYAYEQRASDIHLEPRRDAGRMRFRIDGVLHKVLEVPPSVMTAVVSRIKVLGRMDLAERRRPQDGRIKTRSPGGREVEMRLSTMPTAFGEKVRDAYLRPGFGIQEHRAVGFQPRRSGRLERAGRASARHRAGHRPDRLRQDHHAVFHAQTPGHAGCERVQRGRPDRNDRAGIQPDAGAAEHRPGFRQRRAHAAAPGIRTSS